MEYTVAEAVAFYDQNYGATAKGFLDGSTSIFLGPSPGSVCRFCGKKSPEARFENIAHAFPEAIGNKTLISNYECDVCNELFGRILDDQYSKFLGASRTTARVKGKRGVPSYKSPNLETRVDVRDGNLNIQTVVGNDDVILDEENRTLTITSIRQPYVPRAAYKCLVKMGISVMPVADLGDFIETLEWLRIDPPESDSKQLDSLMLLNSFVSGHSAFPHITYLLLKRKGDQLNVPFYSFFIAWGNYTHQIFLPSLAKDVHLIGRSIEVPRFPNVYDNPRSGRTVYYTTIDLSSSVKTRGEKMTAKYSFASVLQKRLDGRES